MKIKQGIIVICLLGMLLSGCSKLMVKEASQVIVEEAHDYAAEVRGLKLKYVLIDTAYEMYQFQNGFEDNKAVYSATPDGKAHYEWLIETYEAMDGTMQESLDMIMTTNHPWQLMNVTSELDDEASLEEVIECLTTNKLGYNTEQKEQLASFFRNYYDNYLKVYLEEQIPVYDNKAAKLNEVIQQQPADLMTFMEDVSGISFDAKRKPVFYYTLRRVGAMGFKQPGIHISLIARHIEDIDNLYGTPFHEFGHSLFDTFTNKRAFKKIADKLKKEKGAFMQQWENGNKDSYNWIGWCEENLVEGFALYLNDLYYGEDMSYSSTYVYDQAFYRYLKEIEFDGKEMSLEEVSIAFYEKRLSSK